MDGVAHLHNTVFDCNLQLSHSVEKKLFPLDSEDTQINFHIPAWQVSNMHPCARVFVSAPHVRNLAWNKVSWLAILRKPSKEKANNKGMILRNANSGKVAKVS